MEKKIAGLLGAVATLGTFGAVEAAPAPLPAPTDVLRANSFADLLEPIPDAARLLQAVDESAPAKDSNVQLAQVVIGIGGAHHHHHHHHHHSQYRRYAPRIVVVPRRHHHHHHHHHSQYR
jgi:hypothetical protein